MLPSWSASNEWEPNQKDRNRPMELHFLLKEALNLELGIVAGIKFKYFEPVRSGDKITSEQKLMSVSELMETKLGLGRKWNIDVIYTNQNNNQMWTGVSYRLNEGLILLGGMDITKDLRFGIGYDVTTINPMGNSLEVMLGYNFTIKRNKAISKHKNPRFL